ncbi:hypothetical protein C176_13597 [Viridibacillus arenosi FSL R5-213]|uniref:Uncharacterized protein n=1 Tax=Viridibacillus arenosi FSL R5-213 TaxID=1227360 RepID=W4ESD6_9BACL|nr:hypothetical protein C176_13597 [Viridibacillus arenosi FSL R5-213]
MSKSAFGSSLTVLVEGRQDVGQIAVATGRGSFRLSSFIRAASAFKKDIQLQRPDSRGHFHFLGRKL